jgi:hypothetical protein
MQFRKTLTKRHEIDGEIIGQLARHEEQLGTNKGNKKCRSKTGCIYFPKLRLGSVCRDGNLFCDNAVVLEDHHEVDLKRNAEQARLDGGAAKVPEM